MERTAANLPPQVRHRIEDAYAKQAWTQLRLYLEEKGLDYRTYHAPKPGEAAEHAIDLSLTDVPVRLFEEVVVPQINAWAKEWYIDIQKPVSRVVPSELRSFGARLSVVWQQVPYDKFITFYSRTKGGILYYSYYGGGVLKNPKSIITTGMV